MGAVHYAAIAEAIEPTGMTVRGGFVVSPTDEVPAHSTGEPARAVVVVGNVGGAIWPHFRRDERDEPDPLDAWTRRILTPIAARFGADLVHPSDTPFQPILKWAQRAADVWQSPIGLLIDRDHGLWHAYRGALVFADDVIGVPAVRRTTSPCVGCSQPCLSTCPVDAFDVGRYDHERCRTHVRSGSEPRCMVAGCAARRACPVNADGHYGADQMTFHMRAFAG